MKIYVAWVQENEWETQPFNIGVYSSEEKAKKAILEWLNDQGGEQWLSLETYEEQDNPEYVYEVEHFELDESPIE